MCVCVCECAHIVSILVFSAVCVCSCVHMCFNVYVEVVYCVVCVSVMEIFHVCACLCVRMLCMSVGVSVYFMCVSACVCAWLCIPQSWCLRG